MANRSLDRLSNPNRNATTAAQIESGKQFGEVLKARDSAYSDLADVTLFTSMQALDMQGDKNKPVKFLQLSCAEQRKLKKKAESMYTALPKDDFTKNAGLYVTVLTHYECHS